MKSAKSSNRHFKPSARELLPALSEAATAWSPRLMDLDGPAVSARTADSPGSRSASSRPTTYSKYIGRVGALAVALGVGGAIATAPAVAWADRSARPLRYRISHPSSTPSEHSTDDESGGQSGASTSSSKIVMRTTNRA